MDATFKIRSSVRRNGACTETDDLAQAVRSFEDTQAKSWVHIQFADPAETAVILTKQFGFHELAVEDSLSVHERPTLHEYDDHLFLSVSRVTSEGGEENYAEIGFFVTQNALVSVAGDKVSLVDAWFDRWKKNPDRFGQGPVEILHAVIDAIVDEYYVVADRMEDDVDALIDEIYRGDNSQLRELLKLKRRLIELRRHITPIRDIMNGLLRRDIILVSGDSRAYFQDVYDHTLRLAELADISRETLTSALDVHLSTVSNNLNTVMKKMTVISTVLMSGALIAGVYGMNFKHIPELSWIWGYPFAIFLMVLAGAGIVGIFRWKKWI